MGCRELTAEAAHTFVRAGDRIPLELTDHERVEASVPDLPPEPAA